MSPDPDPAPNKAQRGPRRGVTAVTEWKAEMIGSYGPKVDGGVELSTLWQLLTIMHVPRIDGCGDHVYTYTIGH